MRSCALDKLNIALENCYGIRKLESELDFSKSGAIAIYAPNGAMKTSLAETFKDIAEGRITSDRIFPERTTKREIRDENGNELDQLSVAVIKSYETVLPNAQTSTLLVNSDLRLKYEQLLKEVAGAKDRLLKQLKKLSGSKKNIEREMSTTFTKSGDFTTALQRIRSEVSKQQDAPYSSVKYDVIFDEKTQKLLEAEDVKAAIEAYVKSYNALLDKSTYFRRGIFNYYNAATIARNLSDNGFFKAKHTIRLNGSEAKEISTVKELEELIQNERDAITNDLVLRKKYAEIESSLAQNKDLRDLHAYLSVNEHLLPLLSNLGAFREEVWKSYLKTSFDQVEELLSLTEATDESKLAIETAASQERTLWEGVIEIFNDRFSVPFKLDVINKIPVMLGQDKVPTLGFTFNDGDEQADIDRDKLMGALSTGEKKAFYVLNVMFDMQVRMEAGQKSLFIVDDIADSFDYKNKYAIIEYLRDIADHPNFRQIILTHNFDFFRTACSRYVGRKNCLMAVKSSEGIALVEAYGVKNVFNHWKENFFTDPVMKIATIPFIRNIIEYTAGHTAQTYETLTGMLHIKPNTTALTVADLDAVYNAVFGANGASADPGKSLVNFIDEVANQCVIATQGVNFENKIVLSIAIRLAAERFMIVKINDIATIEAIKGNQTSGLHDLFRKKFPDDAESKAVLRQVLLMTPESIHLNSFMYEPIVDMSDDHLRKLYVRVSALN